MTSRSFTTDVDRAKRSVSVQIQKLYPQVVDPPKIKKPRKKGSGGARPGAGRPERAIEMVRVRLRVPEGYETIFKRTALLIINSYLEELRHGVPPSEEPDLE